jgi:hypothetical protein
VVFIPVSSLSIYQGETAQYDHINDRGNTMSKFFCTKCGAQLFTSNSGHPERRGVQVGAIDDASWFQPMANFYTCRKLPSTPIDPNIKAIDKM